MHVDPFLVELLLLIAFATLGVALFERLRLPAITGFLVMGALVGPGGLALVGDPERVRALAELGVVFLLFEIGLELPIDRLRRSWRTVGAAGALQVLGTLALVTAVAIGLGVAWRNAVVIGGLVALSSTALVIGLLSERGEIDAPQGQLAVGILLFQDLCIVPFLLAIPILAGQGAATPAGVALEVGRAGVVLGLFFVVARFVLPVVLERFSRLGSRDAFTLLALLVVVGSAVTAESLGLTLAVGAFIGGLVTRASPYSHQLFAEIVPLRGVFLGLFFTAVGMLFDARAALELAPQILGYVAGVVGGKTLVVLFVLGSVLRQGRRTALLTALALAQTGEFSFVLAATASQAGLLGPAFQQTFVAGSVLTLLATPFLMRAGPPLATWLQRGAEAFSAGAAPDSEGEGRQVDHAVLVGFGVAGQAVARVLRALALPYVVVDSNARTLAALRASGEPVVYGDATRRALLERVGVPSARLLAVAVSDPIATREIVALARRLAPRLPILARSRYVLEVDTLAEAGADAVVSEEYEGSIDLVSEVLRVLGTPEGAIARFTNELRSEGYELLRGPAGLALDPWLAELLQEVTPEWIEVPESFAGEATLAGLEVRARTGANVVGVERDGVLLPNPAPSFAIRCGDRLLALGSADALNALQELLR